MTFLGYCCLSRAKRFDLSSAVRIAEFFTKQTYTTEKVPRKNTKIGQMEELWICGRARKVKSFLFRFFWTSNDCSFGVNNKNRSAVLFAVLSLWHLKEFHNIHITTCQKTVAIRTVSSRARNTADITVITAHHSGQLSQYDFLFPCAVLTARSSAFTWSLTCTVSIWYLNKRWLSPAGTRNFVLFNKMLHGNRKQPRSGKTSLHSSDILRRWNEAHTPHTKTAWDLRGQQPRINF